jgi:predicted component of type VI protein secretion system
MRTLAATQPAIVTLIAVIAGIGTIVHVVTAPLAGKLDTLSADLKEFKAEIKADFKELKADFKELRADLQQVMMALVRIEAQRDNDAGGRKPAR